MAWSLAAVTDPGCAAQSVRFSVPEDTSTGPPPSFTEMLYPFRHSVPVSTVVLLSTTFCVR